MEIEGSILKMLKPRIPQQRTTGTHLELWDTQAPTPWDCIPIQCALIIGGFPMGNQAFIRTTKFTGYLPGFWIRDNLEFFLISSTSCWEFCTKFETGQNFEPTTDCEQSLNKSAEQPTFLRRSCFVTQTNKKTEGGLGWRDKKGTEPFSVTNAFRITKSDNLLLVKVIRQMVLPFYC